MKQSIRSLLLLLTICFLFPRSAKAIGNDNPTGVGGSYYGSITTGGAIDPYTGNASRVVNDIAPVPGSVGAYPLQWTRVLSTRNTTANGRVGAGGWTSSYSWSMFIRHGSDPLHWNELDPHYEGPDCVVYYPDGRAVEFYGEPGSSYWAMDSVDTNARLEYIQGQDYDLILSDGGKVTFRATPTHIINGVQYYSTPIATSVIDPYGQTIVLLRNTANRLWKITEPGGRYLEITYTSSWLQGIERVVIDKVWVFDGRGTLTQTVDYTYEPKWFGGSHLLYLTRVDYDDGTHASYTYQEGNAGLMGLVWTCDDVRYAGAMKKIKYEYMSSVGRPDVGFGQVKAERNATTGQIVTEIIYPPYPPSGQLEDPVPYRRTERRGDDPTATRVFQYSVWEDLPETHTDFENHTTTTAYVYNTPVNNRSYKIVTDARQKQTTIERQIFPVMAVMSVTHHDNSQVSFEYTDNNYPYYLASRTDENEKPTSYTRNQVTHQIERIDYPDGGFETFTYDNNPFGLVHEHRMTSGGTEVFEYDTRGLKTTYTPPATPSDLHPELHKTRYFYYEPGDGRNDRIDRLWYVIDPRGYTTSYDYNERGQVTRVTHQHDGTFTQSNYNDDGTLEWTEDELGHRTSYLYDEYKRVTKVTNHLNEYNTISYDPNPDLSVDLSLTHTTSSVYRTTSFLGRQTDCKYDRNFRKVETTQAPGTDDQARSSFAYDEVGNLITLTDPREKTTTYGYDDRNRQVSVRNDELNETTEFRYDPVGNKTREIRPDNGFRTWRYDEMNRVSHAYDWRLNEDPRPDQTTTYDRDHAGNPLFITDAKGAIYRYEYDELGRKKKATYPMDATGLERTESWLYDFAGNLKVYKNPAGQFKHFEYDERNRQRRAYWNGSELSETPNWNVGAETTTTLDHASRVTEVRTNGGETVVGFEYDHANRKLWEDQTVAGHPTRRVKTDLDGDGKRQNLQIVDPPQEGGGIIISPEMTGTGVYSIAYTYTQRNQLTRISGEDWRFDYFYDESGNMTTRQAHYNGRSSATHCPTESYDALNRPARWEQSGPDGFQALSHYRYDRANREEATWREEENNLGEHFVYEVTNQLKRVSYNGAIPPPSPTPTPSATPPNATPTPTAPPSQQVAAPTFNPDDGHIFFTTGSKTIAVMTTTANAQMRYTFGATLPTASEGTLIAASSGQVSITPTVQGTTLNVIAFKPGLSDSAVSSATYFYDEGMAPGAGQRIVTYNYAPDKLNRSNMHDTATQQTTSYTAFSQLNQYTNVGGVAYTYDNKFNLTGAEGFGGVYDAANRLVSAWNSATAAQAEVALVYDGLGRCVKRTVGGVATIFIYDEWKPIAEWDESVPEYFRAWNVYGPGADEILLRHSAKYGYTRYHSDLHGNVKFLLDNDGQLQEKYTYDVFGLPKITDAYGNPRDLSWWDNRFLFQGREYIAEIGVYDYRNRFYHPELGRFLQIDPIGFDAGDMNLFRYCGDDPVSKADPLGLDYDNLEAASHEARRQIMTEVSNPNRYFKDVHFKTGGGAGRTERYYPGIYVPVLRAKSGKGYELGKMSHGTVKRQGDKYYDAEGEWHPRLVKPIHSHNNNRSPHPRPGLGRPEWGEPDRKLKMVERMDESNPGVWHSRTQQKNGRYKEDTFYDNGSQRTPGSNGSGQSSSGSQSSRPGAAEVDADHQATGVPSQAAEAVNVHGAR